jgi:hypothetical protein
MCNYHLILLQLTAFSLLSRFHLAQVNAPVSNSPVAFEALTHTQIPRPTEFIYTNTLPLDQFAFADSEYLAHCLQKRKFKTTDISIQLENSRFMQDTPTDQLKSWLTYAKAASSWDTCRILESPNFDIYLLGQGSDDDENNALFINSLPEIYLNRLIRSPFTAFMHRFQYPKEFNHSESHISSITLSPLLKLVLKFIQPQYLQNSVADSFFKIILETQPEFFLNSPELETFLFSEWFHSGPDGWKYFFFYFELVLSSTKIDSLAKFISSIQEEEAESSSANVFEFIHFALSLPNFNINIPFTNMDSCVSNTVMIAYSQTPLCYRIAMNPKLPYKLLKSLLQHANLDLSIPTGNVRFSRFGREIVYTNQPLLFLLAIVPNIWGFLVILLNGHILSHCKISNVFAAILIAIFHHLFLFIKWTLSRK